MQRPLKARIARETSRRPAPVRVLARVLTTSILATLAGPLAHAGCGRPFAEGGSGEITVISEWPSDAPESLLLRAILEREAVRIESEPAYSVRFVGPRDTRAYRARNVLVIGAGPVANMPKPARRLAGLLSHGGDPFVFTTDVWLRGQSAGLIWADSRPDWIRSVAATQNRLFHALDRSTFATVRARVSSLPHDDRLERRLADEVAMKLRVPRGYRLTVKSGNGAALLLDEGPPARLFRVAALRDSMADLRSARAGLARLFRPNERTLALSEPVLTPNELKGSMRQLHGRWEDEKVTAAGPFRAYEVRRGARRYLVDLAVFAPGRPKLPYLRELMAIAETLEPVSAP